MSDDEDNIQGLRQRLREAGLPHTGSKAQLQKRWTSFQESVALARYIRRIVLSPCPSDFLDSLLPLTPLF